MMKNINGVNNINNTPSLIFKNLFKLNPDESVLILHTPKQKHLAVPFFNYLKDHKNKTIVEIKEPHQSGEEPEKAIENKMLKSDIILMFTIKSLSHTNARKRANKAGARIASMPGITEDILNRSLDLDYNDLKDYTKKIEQLLRKGEKVRITTELGTDIEFSIKNRNPVDDYGDLSKKGSFDNLPSGECFIAPVENIANGTYIVDESHAGLKVPKLSQPIKITVKDGYAVDIDNKELLQLLQSISNKDAFNIAEFGIGTNPKAIISGNILEDEKVRGTCHIALGSNFSFGGNINVPIHIDGIITKPTIYIDNKKVIDGGVLIIN